ncbi:PTS galactitol transporter subunit IIC [Enterococcus gallinarum]|jgi:PTS system galactitol-specific IIC component|uniref:PTS galactitol transporter subunit IIC n=1 Tax=Enterococcus gallinarum TaxID=1353 RepID=A0AAE7T123_ENTGA|nr:PTS transporter subunit IIC [Enterococcus gallinarum]MBM6740549.1 PTS galactitol transporter subunit IIC [Enterococcus gallinarum]MCR1926625.1 PTS galactitol transporter subunit IIC [Enterococcus gallinarum]MDT2680016.1 PTS transporter subunit IIC [Enterococcus gallinarum]MUN90621.1 PTS galactitol transporter subunit IIC [Enterococcus gallinarum]QOG28609.1 PTS galactitol transporter subunit IIC [Enterococcus gallinarum]
MQLFQDIINYILGLGSAIFVPLIILILGLIAGMKVKKAFMSAITLGIAFTGMSMVIGFMSNAVSPASEALAKNTGLNLPALDLGWTGAASITWSWSYAFVFFAVVLGVNFVMLMLNWTKTLNVDMWNVWGKALTAYLVYFISGSLLAGFATAIVQVILELKMGDMFQRHIEDLTGIPLVTVTHLMNISAVLLLPINVVMDKIPFFNKRADTKALKKKIGVFSENSVMGFIIGLGLGLAAAYGVSGSLNLAIQIATAMALFPMISKMFMQSLSPLADAMSEMMKKRFKDREVYIGLDWPVLAGRSEIWVTAILLVPVFIGYAIILPGNAVLPLAGIINYSIAVGGLLLTGGNLVRMLIMGVISMPIYLYAATYLTPILTGLADKTGAVEGIQKGQKITWSSIEGPEFRILFAEAFKGNLLSIVGAVVFIAMFVWLYNYMSKAKVPSQRYEELNEQRPVSASPAK